MIDALVGGKLFGAPVARTSKTGSKFATCKVRVAMRDEVAWLNVVAFSETVVTALLELGDGDSVAFSGELKVATYTAKDGTIRPSLDLVAHGLLTAYCVSRRRKAARPNDAPTRDDGAPFDDSLEGIGGRS